MTARREASASGFAPLARVNQENMDKNLDGVVKGDFPTVLPEGHEVEDFSEGVFSFMMRKAPNYIKIKALRN